MIDRVNAAISALISRHAGARTRRGDGRALRVDCGAGPARASIGPGAAEAPDRDIARGPGHPF
jgi:hypothetical protein